jgi:hypothetical protein
LSNPDIYSGTAEDRAVAGRLLAVRLYVSEGVFAQCLETGNLDGGILALLIGANDLEMTVWEVKGALRLRSGYGHDCG